MLGWTLGNCRVEVLEGSIVELPSPFDALVSSDDNYLTHGGGVSCRLWGRAGLQLQRWVNGNRRQLRLGDVFVSPAFGLPARHLLHAITIDFDEHRRLGPAEARSLYRAVFDQAELLGCASVAFPLLGAGAARLTALASAKAALDAIDERIAVPSTLTRLTLVAISGIAGQVRPLFEERLSARPDLTESIFAVGDERSEIGLKLIEAWRRLEDGEGPFAAVTLLEAALEALVDRAPGATAHQEISREIGGDVAAALLNRATARFEAARAPLPSELLAACREAIEARNRLIHLRPDSSDALRLQRQVLHAAAMTLAHVTGHRSRRLRGAGGLPSVTSLVGGAIAGALAGTGANRRRPEPPRDAETTSSSVAAGDRRAVEGTDHVRWLHRFLTEQMDRVDLDYLVEELGREGYTGTPEFRLLEKCVRDPEPEMLLVAHLSPRKIAAALRAATGEAPRSAGARELARRLLEAHGFPERQSVPDLHEVREKLRDLRNNAAADDLHTVVGSVSDASSLLERQVEFLIRFLCKAILEVAPEVHIRNRGYLPEGHALEKCSLGKLLELVEKIARDVAAAESDRARLLRESLGTGRLLPERTDILTKLRNDLVHWEEEEQLSAVERRARAQRFFESALTLVEHFSAPANRVFPHLLRIERIELDAHGRRTVIARGEGGRMERLFCDDDLRPGQLYLMHPRSNPLRVDPILVPAGELTARRKDKKPD